MELLDLQKKLIAAARAEAADERVPFAFEKRVMARLGASPRVTDALAVWSRALWQSAVACVAIALVCGAWSYWSEHHGSASNFPDEFESAVFASASSDEAW